MPDTKSGTAGWDYALAFLALAQTKNFATAGRLIGVSGSGLRARMSRLEEELGFPLVEPTGRFRLTPAGERVARACRQSHTRLMKQWKQALQTDAESTLTIGVTDAVRDSILSRVRAEFHRSMPEVTLRTRRFDEGELAVAVLSGRCFYGIGMESPVTAQPGRHLVVVDVFDDWGLYQESVLVLKKGLVDETWLEPPEDLWRRIEEEVGWIVVEEFQDIEANSKPFRCLTTPYDYEDYWRAVRLYVSSPWSAAHAASRGEGAAIVNIGTASYFAESLDAIALPFHVPAAHRGWHPNLIFDKAEVRGPKHRAFEAALWHVLLNCDSPSSLRIWGRGAASRPALHELRDPLGETDSAAFVGTKPPLRGERKTGKASAPRSEPARPPRGRRRKRTVDPEALLRRVGVISREVIGIPRRGEGGVLPVVQLPVEVERASHTVLALPPAVEEG